MKSEIFPVNLDATNCFHFLFLLRRYLKKIYSSLRVNVIRSWCQKVLNALQYLHENNIVHGELSCESIYINSNNGEIKVGDVGIKHIHTSDTSHELGASVIYRK